MDRRGCLALAAAGAVLLLGAASATATAHYAGYGENDVSNEASHPFDFGDFDTDNLPGNGFRYEQANQWDLVLDGYAVPDDLHHVDANVVLSDVLENLGRVHKPLLFPGTVDYNAWWGWWQDKGSGAWAQEMGQGGSALAGEPDDVIDDGADNHTADVHYSGAAENCPPDEPTCWQTTGTWDEWILRGSGLSDWALAQSPPPSDPPTTNYNDQMKLFIDPGTTARTLDVATGHPEDQRGPSRPGYAVLSDADPRWSVPDANCEAGGYEDDRGDQSAGESWQCVAGVTTDRSLLVTTRVQVAVNAPLQSGASEARNLLDAFAQDTDVYSTVAPGVSELYRTAVWDPDDREETPVLEEFDAYPDEGPKEVLLEAYTENLPTVYGAATDVVAQAIQPTEPFRGFARDHTVDPPWPHEPNHPDDDLPGAVRGSNPADYNGNLGADEDDDGQTTYYEPNDQSWQGYYEAEHLWADFFQWYTPLPNLLVGGGFGTNVYGVGSPDDQNTHIPGLLVPYARGGTWADQNRDTWIGSAHPLHAYQNGTVDDPNAYGSDEFRYLCSGEAELEATFYPALEPRRDVNDDGKTNIKDRPWGTTTPPLGVYAWDSFGSTAGGILQDVQDGQLDRHVQHGPITIGMGCSGRSAGTYFPGNAILFPAGTVEYPVVMEGTADMIIERTDRVNPGTFNETLTDVDVVNSWT
jgi:hypothetical protein